MTHFAISHTGEEKEKEYEYLCRVQNDFADVDGQPEHSFSPDRNMDPPYEESTGPTDYPTVGYCTLAICTLAICTEARRETPSLQGLDAFPGSSTIVQYKGLSRSTVQGPR